MTGQPKVLLICSDQLESRALEGILSEHVNLQSVGDITELRTKLDGKDYDAIFCGWSFHRGMWNEALADIQQRDPNLPVIIFSRHGGEREWVEVLEAGAFDLLVPPFGKLAVLAVLEQAVDSYEARRVHSVVPGTAMLAAG
jgi:two-component system nitrogen regulation response regulator NtrX